MIPRQKGWSFIIRFPNIWEKPESTFFFFRWNTVKSKQTIQRFSESCVNQNIDVCGPPTVHGHPITQICCCGKSGTWGQTGLHPTSTLTTISGILQVQGLGCGGGRGTWWEGPSQITKTSDRWHSWRNVTEESPLRLNEASNIQCV